MPGQKRLRIPCFFLFKHFYTAATFSGKHIAVGGNEGINNVDPHLTFNKKGNFHKNNNACGQGAHGKPWFRPRSIFTNCGSEDRQKVIIERQKHNICRIRQKCKTWSAEQKHNQSKTRNMDRKKVATICYI